MKILVIAPYPPFPTINGGRLRLLRLLERLSLIHDITLISQTKPTDADHTFNIPGIGYYPVRRSLGIKVVANTIRHGSVFAGSFWNDAVRSRLLQLEASQHFDIVHVVSSFTLGPIRDTLRSYRLVVEEPNLESEALRQRSRLSAFALRFPLWVESRRLCQMETLGQKSCSTYIVSSPLDYAIARERNQDSTITVVANGAGPFDTLHESVEKLSPPVFGFFGNFAYWPNVDAAVHLIERTLPRVVRSIPKACLHIVGYKAQSKLKRYTNRSPNLIVQDFVDDLDSIVRGWSLTACPIRVGTGSRIKILQSMAVGTPVVSTRSGASGLGIRTGAELAVVEDELFDDAVLSLLADLKRQEDYRTAAYSWVTTERTWDRSAEQLDDAYRLAIAK